MEKILRIILVGLSCVSWSFVEAGCNNGGNVALGAFGGSLTGTMLGNAMTAPRQPRERVEVVYADRYQDTSIQRIINDLAREVRDLKEQLELSSKTQLTRRIKNLEKQISERNEREESDSLDEVRREMAALGRDFAEIKRSVKTLNADRISQRIERIEGAQSTNDERRSASRKCA